MKIFLLMLILSMPTFASEHGYNQETYTSYLAQVTENNSEESPIYVNEKADSSKSDNRPSSLEEEGFTANALNFVDECWYRYSHTKFHRFICELGTLAKWIGIIALIGIGIALIKFIILFVLTPFFAGLVLGAMVYIFLWVLNLMHLFPEAWIWPATKGAYWIGAAIFFLYQLFHIGEVWYSAQTPIRSNSNSDNSPDYETYNRSKGNRVVKFQDSDGNLHYLRNVPGSNNLYIDECSGKYWTGGYGDYSPLS